MTTLISSYNSDGCIGRCDAKCHEAKEPFCDCICGGMNHGKGGAKAMTITRDYIEIMVEKYFETHPDVTSIEIPALAPFQLSLF